MPGPSKLNESSNIPRGTPNTTRLIFHADPNTGLGQSATIGELLALMSTLAPVTTYSNNAAMLDNTDLGVGYMAYVVETNSIYLYQGPDPADLNSYILLASGGGSGGGGMMGGHFTFDDPTAAADPGAGMVRFNNTAFELVTEIYIDALTMAAVNWGAVLEDMATGDQIRFQVAADDDNNVLFEFTALPVDHDGWWTLEVVHISSAGTFFVDDAELVATVVLVGIAETDFNVDGGRSDSVYNTIPGIDGGTP